MSAKVLTADAAKEAKIDLIEDGRGTQAVHDAVVAMRAARRSGSANTKTKAAVNFPAPNRGGKREPAALERATSPRQSGVAAAWSSGRIRAIIPRKFPRPLRRLAFQKALTERIKAGDVLTLEHFAVKEAKTKSFLAS